MVDRSRIVRSALGSARIALTIFVVTIAGFLIRPLIDFLFGDKFQVDLGFALKFSLVVSAIWFCGFFIWIWITAARLEPALDILDEEPPPSALSKLPLTGFVPMEYYWLILNRTYVVFIAPEGLYGWKARGPVTNGDPTFYEPYQEMLKDNEFMRDRQAIEKLSRLRGGFFIERTAIVSVEYNERPKWGMGGIPQSGRINVKLADGKTREFILLGFAMGDELVNKIVTTLGVSTSNPIQV
ncbi:MAG: hypothetical protein ABR928_00675 [Terracidiphilus sp.]|jgi:hypothetical protein